MTVARGVVRYVNNLPQRATWAPAAGLCDRAARKHEAEYKALLARGGDGANPYRLHAELGSLMTAAATVVRRNDELEAAYGKVCEMEQRARGCALADTGDWANQNVVFVRALRDMFPLAKTILKGALARDECRGAHYKPEFAMPDVDATDPAQQRRQAEAWCERFDANNRKWLKSTVATLSADGEPELSYEDVDTSLIAPRPRLYGVVGGETIEETWKLRQAKKATETT